MINTSYKTFTIKELERRLRIAILNIDMGIAYQAGLLGKESIKYRELITELGER
jgi:hypothetical protein